MCVVCVYICVIRCDVRAPTGTYIFMCIHSGMPFRLHTCRQVRMCVIIACVCVCELLRRGCCAKGAYIACAVRCDTCARIAGAADYTSACLCVRVGVRLLVCVCVSGI